MSRWRALSAFAVLGATLAATAGTAGAAEAGNRHGFDLQAHRGGLGLVVESTLPAFANALELGVSTLELDIQITEDGQAVVTHDRRISGRVCRDTAPAVPDDPEFPYVGKYINTLTLAQVRTMDCGSVTKPEFPGQRPVPGARMALLREVFDLVNSYRARRVALNVETKVEAGAPMRRRRGSSSCRSRWRRSGAPGCCGRSRSRASTGAPSCGCGRSSRGCRSSR